MQRPLLAALALLLLPAGSPAEEYRAHFKNLVIPSGQTIGEVHCFGCFTRVEGKIEGELISLFGGAEILGEVHGDVIVVGGGLKLGPQAIVSGDLIVIGGPIERDPASEVGDDVVNQWWLYLPGQRQIFLGGASVFVGLTLGLALFAYAVFGLRRTQEMTAAFRRRPFVTLLLGLILTVLGIYGLDLAENLGHYEDPAVYAILVVGFLLAWPGFAAQSLWLGGLVGRSSVVAVIAGSLLWTLGMILPVLGIVVCCLLFALCVGTSAVGRFGFRRQSALQPQI